jgi:hypothetical protein
MPRLLAGGGLPKEALYNTFREAANLLRKHQHNIALAAFETRDEVVDDLARMLAMLAIGNLGALPGAEGTGEARARLGKRLRDMGRLLIIGFAPTVIVLAISQVFKIPGGAFSGALVLFCILWAIVNLLVALDPLYGTKLSAVKDIGSTIREIISIKSGGN